MYASDIVPRRYSLEHQKQRPTLSLHRPSCHLGKDSLREYESSAERPDGRRLHYVFSVTFLFHIAPAEVAIAVIVKGDALLSEVPEQLDATMETNGLCGQVDS